ncbi:hypothetical protein C8Q75DRAFT_801457 [Abortiporus biennis]|nr:hypothetical protein C8Q75DRAFT_801457 [Abortiporus biennis]
MDDQAFGEDHPLALELTSLRAAVTRYQHEAHATSVKLQHHSLDSSQAVEKSHLLEREVTHLREEVQTLREYPDITPHPASLQVPELTLALRKLSDKLTLTEESLTSRTNELLDAQHALSRAKFDTEAAHTLVKDAHIREQTCRERERELERKARAAEEERKMADFAVQEYADLVRSLEGRPKSSSRPSFAINESNGSSTSISDSLAEGRLGLQKLLEEFNAESERLKQEVSRLQLELENTSKVLESERKGAHMDRSKLATALVELDKYKVDDTTAAKMVSRYMKFSQSTTDSLQRAMENLKTRHAATTASLNTQIDNLQRSIHSQRRQSETLRRALDDLSEDISREAYGRRREVSLRLAFLGREEGLAENLRRWIRKSKESFERVLSSNMNTTSEASSLIDPKLLEGTIAKVLEDAEGLLDSLNGQPTLEGNTAGSVARVIAAQDAVKALTKELQHETDRRLEAERRLAHFESMDPDEIRPVHRHTPKPSVDSVKVKENGVPTLQDPTTPKGSDTVPVLPLTSVKGENPTLASNKDDDNTPASHFTFPSIESSDSSVGFSDSSTTLVNKGEIATSDSSTIVPPGVPKVNTAPADTTLHIDTPIVDNAAIIVDLTNTPLLSTSEDPIPDALGLDTVTSILPEQAPISADLSTPHSDTVSTPSIVINASTGSAVSSITVAKDSIHSLPTNGEPGHAHPVALDDLFSQRPVSVDAPATIQTFSEVDHNSTNGDQPTAQSDNRHDLLVALLQVKHRYDELQRSFRDCHLALTELKKNVTSLPRSSSMTSVVQTAVERLDDFNEDVRVELEIRVADEERIHAGYETLLTVPGAISDEVDEKGIEREILSFVEGKDKVVAKAMQQFSKKLEDLQHDIASIKRTIHEMVANAESEESSNTPMKSSPGWSSWAGGLLGSSPTPRRPSSPAPTFGSVMTSPRTRVASLNMKNHSTSSANPSSPSTPDPFASLGLRIPMPSSLPPAMATSPSYPYLSPATPSAKLPRPRTASASAMYMLGIGSSARRSSFGLNSPRTPTRLLSSSSTSPVTSSSKLVVSLDEGTDTETENEEDLDSDVE